MDIESLDTLTPAQKIAAHNHGQALLGYGEEKFVKKFRDHATADRRLAKVREDLEKMHGYAELIVDDGQPRWRTERPKEVVASEPGDPAAELKRASTTKLPLGEMLHVMCDGNPKRPSSRSFLTFELYSADGVVTGEDFIAAMEARGYSRRLAMSTLHWDLDKGYIQLGGKPDDTIVATIAGLEHPDPSDPRPMAPSEEAA